MLLIADSGSTKCDWRLVNEDKTFRDFKSIGLNPYFHNEDVIASELNSIPSITENADKVTAVFFYGAGCSSTALKRIVHSGLDKVFPNAEIYVDHDLVAAAFAVYEDEPCIACILGTGSNSCHFNGDIVREEVPAIAYILGDEGSGSYFGKQLLRDFLYKKLPDNINQGLLDEFQLDKNTIIDRVYRQPDANVYLASFMRFISSFRTEPYIRNMIREGLEKFIDIHVKCFRDSGTVKTHFVGSVAFYQEDILREVAAEKGILVGNIIKRPIEGLFEYHLKNYFSKTPINS